MPATADVWDEPAEAPILVLGSGQRCGSTLVQRLLTSHPGVLVWGEHGGHLRDLLSMNDVLTQWDANVAVHGRQAFDEGGHNSWIANMLPGTEPLRVAARAYLHELFAVPAAERGRPRWGFKEVRFGPAEASALRDLFPRLTAIHLTRDPRDVLVSLDSWERGQGWWTREYTEAAIALWVVISRDFLEARDLDWVLSRRYEDVVADPEGFTRDVARLLGTEPDRFDASVFARRIHGTGEGDRALADYGSLAPELRALIETDEAREVAAAWGYA